ncbi:amidohydrolase family protein [Sphingomonas sp. 10B4]|uniref:amidohydrolase family protein n=1 Tax=Sphingomonas sp. 10B4 TaxID=3048575 RepID=UPI002AB45B31|nr:amidohydrolase family protein [Sphingomonas sp. 10B4]MDY7523304.1 amidohydrolase family protein [Sphingomonas sp. 10B4]MEB0283465.1 amidohydrolase family protein [Sphingomonas sp. 10B4]
MKRLLLLSAAFLAAPAAAQSVAITNAKLVIGDGSAPIEGGTVIVRDGRVVAAGRSIAVPTGTATVDAGGRWVTPGIVAGFTRMGIVESDGVEETNDTAARGSPFHAAIDVAPAVNPATSSIPLNRAEGITRAIVAPDTDGSIFAGLGAVIDLGTDRSPITKPRAFQFMEYGGGGSRRGNSRPAMVAMFRNALAQVKDYVRAPAAYSDQGKDALLTRADAAALVPVASGAMPLLVHVERASDMLALIDLKRDYPALKLVFVGAAEGWLVANQIAAARIPVIASALTDLPASFDQLGATQSNVGRLKAAGVLVGIGTINDDEARQARLEKQYAGNLVALTKVPGATGLDWNAAFAAISSAPAEAIGMGDEIGSLRAGRRGDVVIWDGDPLELGSAVAAVYIDGVKQPLRTRQDALRERYRVPQEGTLPKAYER